MTKTITSGVFAQTKQWFELAIPKPTKDNQRVQVGVHFEECSEMLDTVTEVSPDSDGNRLKIECTNAALSTLAETLKQNTDFKLQIKDRKELLDSLCDQIVTACGVGHMYGFDMIGALNEVNRSNYSKFVDGKPLFNENGKITKGPDYSKPDLTPYMGSDPTI